MPCGNRASFINRKVNSPIMAELQIYDKAGRREYAKLNKAIHDCDKTLEKVWYAKGMMMLKMRESGLYKYGQGKPTFDETGKEVEWTFEYWLHIEHQITKMRGYQLLNAVNFLRKLEAAKVNQNDKMVYSETQLLPTNERQIRPLLTDLEHDGERIYVWQEVVNSGEKKITAELVQRKVDEFKASGLVVDDVEIKLPSVTDKDLLSDTERLKREKQQAREAAIAEQTKASPLRPTIEMADAVEWLRAQEPCDLLLTDPPYATDVEDIAAFAQSWLPLALSKVKPTGRAFVFIGAYPAELAAYLATAMPDQVLVWTYRNTLGPTPKENYKLNWQAILYFKGSDAPPLDCPVMLEQFSVQDINAPDGRQGDRYHAWQKPLEIAERFIRHSTKPGDTVIDPFACTGTFLIAAAKLGRHANGCDISHENIAIAGGRGCLTSNLI